MGFHGLEVLMALEEMSALTTGVLCANGLTVKTLRGHALGGGGGVNDDDDEVSEGRRQARDGAGEGGRNATN